MNYLKQIYYDMRERPLLTWVTVSGTALSIFLLMSTYMVNRIGTLEMSPESRRERILSAPFVHEKSNVTEYSGSMSSEAARELYSDIDGVEHVSFYSSGVGSDVLVSSDGITYKNYRVNPVDDEYWNIFDFEFVTGSPFTQAEIESGVREVIVSESTARELGEGRDLTGQEILLDNDRYMVKGIVRDTHPFLANTWGQIWKAWREVRPERGYGTGFNRGETSVFLLLAQDADPATVKKEVARRYEVYNTIHAKDSISLIYHGSPFTMEEQTVELWSNVDPDIETPRRNRYILYAILLLLPAINLSGMTRSRLRRRMMEIGVRRAYGATRLNIMSQLIGENFLLSLAGGMIGLVISVIFMISCSNLFIDYLARDWDVTEIQTAARPVFSMLFNWQVFLLALIFCFILNIISTGIPAWKASRISPSEAISGHND